MPKRACRSSVALKSHLGKRWFYYDDALRMTRQDLPTGASETASYNDAAMTASFTKSGLGTSTVTYDGFERVTQAVDANNGQANTNYNAMGQVASRTNQFTAGGTPGAATAYQYDALSRVMFVTLPDNQTAQTTYSGSSVTATDQVNMKIRRESDGLGRLVKVTEQDASGNLAQETTYSYNLIDKLTVVNQGSQTRSYKYDALGRLLYEKIPEQTATINDGAGTFWTTKYTYTDFGAVATKTDARGVVSTYSYDQMNRLTSVAHNTSNAPGVASGAGASYTYDNNDSSPTDGLLLSAGNESYTYDSYRRLASITRAIDSINYTTSYQYGAGDIRSRITYPSTRVVNINRGSTGRLSSLTDGTGASYLSGIGYNAAGQVTGLTLGNGVAEVYGYDANRLQMTSQTATKSGGPQNGLMNLTYSYQATAGQNGAGTTAGNVSQLMTISGSINSTTESAAYTYDLPGRLAPSNQTSNGASVQRRFSYDRWGNRTSVYDAVSGGNQIQSAALQLSGGVPTNRLTSVTTSGTTASYTYDAAGNVTSDGAHSYTYDAENRVVSVDGGATAQYSYDQRNRRIKKTVGSAVTHFVWEGSQVVSEHASAGATVAEYIYSGSRMIAKATGGVMRYYLSDRLSERLVLDASGNVVGRQAHLPFGEDFAESNEQEKHHFTSSERDAETGLDYAINRGYSAGAGRFNQADPYRASGYMTDPQSWNRYTYTRNDPVNKIDPTGLIWLNIIIPGPKEVMNVNAGGQKIDPSSYGILGMATAVMEYWRLHGYAREDKSLDRGGEPDTISIREALEAFFKAKPHCAEFFASKGKKDGSLYDRMISEGPKATVSNINEMPNPHLTFQDLGTPPPLNLVPGTHIDNILNEPDRGGRVTSIAFTVFNSASKYHLTIFVGDNYDNLHNQFEKDLTIAHETLHVVFGGANHYEILAGLGLKITDFDDDAASKRLDKFLRNNCRE